MWLEYSSLNLTHFQMSWNAKTDEISSKVDNVTWKHQVNLLQVESSRLSVWILTACVNPISLCTWIKLLENYWMFGQKRQRRCSILTFIFHFPVQVSYNQQAQLLALMNHNSSYIYKWHNTLRWWWWKHVSLRKEWSITNIWWYF